MSRYDKPSHRVYMQFQFREGWRVSFLEANLKQPLPRTLTFSDPEKIRVLARRGEALGTAESRLILDYSIERGSGGMYLNLTPEQYRKLTVRAEQRPIQMPTKVPPRRADNPYRRQNSYGRR